MKIVTTPIPYSMYLGSIIGPYVPFEVPICGNSGTVLFRVLDLQGNINVGRKSLKFFEPRANSAGGGEDAGRLRICKCFGLESGP